MPTASRLLWPLAPLKTNLFCPCLFKRHSISQALCSAWFVVSLGFACWRYASLWSFWPLALVQQAQAAIFFVVLCRLGGAVLFRGSRPSPNPSYRFWLLALTFQSSRPAFCGRLTSPVSPLHIQSCRPLLTPALRLSQRFLLWVFGAAPGFACMRCASFKPFWHLALASQAPVAIVLEGPRRFRGAVLFRGPRPSSMLGAPFWPSGLTVRRSRPPSAAAELRALARLLFPLISAHEYPSAIYLRKRLSAGCLAFARASPA